MMFPLMNIVCVLPLRLKILSAVKVNAGDKVTGGKAELIETLL